MGTKIPHHFKLNDSWRHRKTGFDKHALLKFCKEHKRSFLSGFLLFVLLALLFGVADQLPVPAVDNPPPSVTVMSYSLFVEQVKAGNVLAVTIQGNALTGILAQPLHGRSCTDSSQSDTGGAALPWTSAPTVVSGCSVYTYLPTKGGSAALVALLVHHRVAIKTQPVAQTSFAQYLLGTFAPIVLLVLFMLFLFPQSPLRKDPNSLQTMDKKISRIARDRTRRFERSAENLEPRPHSEVGQPARVDSPAVSGQSSPPSVTFADVAGIDEIRGELEEVVRFLHDPSHAQRLGAHVPRGVLLVGLPGTGKTLLAKAVAGEAGVPFFAMSASEFVEIYAGVGASRVRDLFNQARQSSPCVVFIDELDAVGQRRSLHIVDHGERDQTLNQLLVEMDGFDSRYAVIVLAATNRVDMLDRALLRPGRFDRQLNIPLPDRSGREAILHVHTRHTPLHNDVRLDQLARRTTGMSGADLANLVNEAALLAAHRDLDAVTQACFEEALARIQLGIQRSLLMSEAERHTIAYHESGHALVTYYLPCAQMVNSITILPRGQHLGATQLIDEEDHHNYSRETLMARLAVGLGGRVAEELTFGPEGVTIGAEDDLRAVTTLAWRMVTHWGMGKQLGAVFADFYGIGGTGLHSHTSDFLASCSADQQGLLAREIPCKDGGRENMQEKRLHCPWRDSIGGLAKLQPQEERRFAYQRAHPMIPFAERYITSAAMATLIDREVQDIVYEAHATASTVLSEHDEQLAVLAHVLLERERLNREQFEAVLKG